MAVSLFDISVLLTRLLRLHNRVSVPGIGAFVTEYKPAAIVKGGKLLLPPTKTVAFSANELWNDGFLEDELATQGISKEEIRNQLDAFVQEMDALLKEGKRVEFPDFGTLRISADGEYIFEKDRELNLLPEAFGLPELKVTPHGNVRAIIYTPVPEASPKELENSQAPPAAEENIEKAKPKKKRYIIWIIIAAVFCTAIAFTARSVYIFYRNQPKIIEMPNGNYILSK